MTGHAVPETLRTRSLAERAGCSVQHVRDLEREGALPPADRASNGYRRFTMVHLHALLAHQALAAALGPAEAGRLMRLALAGPARVVVAALDEAHAGLHAERQALRRARDAAAAISGEDGDPARPGDLMTVAELAGALGVRTSALRHWEAEGLLRPGRDPLSGKRSYSPDDVRDARIVDQLRRAGHPIPRLRDLLDDVRRLGARADLDAALETRVAQLDARSAALLRAGGDLTTLLSSRS